MDKITVENVNQPGWSGRVDAAKYSAMRHAMITALKTQSDPLDSKAIKQELKPLLPENLFPGGATSGWWIKCVQLDLEAKGILARTTDKPLRFYLTPGPHDG